MIDPLNSCSNCKWNANTYQQSAKSLNSGLNQGAKRNIIPRWQTTLGLWHRNVDTFTNTSFCFELWPDKWLLKSANCPSNVSLQFCGISFFCNITFATLVGSFSLRREWGCKLNYPCLKGCSYRARLRH